MVNKFAEKTVKLNRSSINHVSFYIFVTLRYLCLACYLLIIFSVSQKSFYFEKCVIDLYCNSKHFRAGELASSGL